MADINPIFVLEGDAPELKRDVMAARNAIQFRGAAPKRAPANGKPNVTRKRFKGVLKEASIISIIVITINNPKCKLLKKLFKCESGLHTEGSELLRPININYCEISTV